MFQFSEWYKEAHIIEQSNQDLLEEMEIDLEKLNWSQRKLAQSIKGEVDLIDLKNGKYPVLIRVYGRRKLRTRIVEPTWKSLLQKSCFVLDMGNMIYIWKGKKLNRMAAAKGLDIASRIRMKDRGGNATYFTLEEGEKHPQFNQFWKILANGKKPEIIDESDPDEEDRSPIIIKIYKVSKAKVTLAHQGKPTSRDILLSNSVYIIQSDREFWIWTGSKSSKEDKKLAYLVLEVMTSLKLTW